jgi:hypothetical protein
MVSSGFLQEPHGVTTQKTPFFIVTAVKTSNLTDILLLGGASTDSSKCYTVEDTGQMIKA